MTQKKPGKSSFAYTSKSQCILKEVRAGVEVESMEECCLLKCSLLRKEAFFYNPGPWIALLIVDQAFPH